jgi:hypothetical protein
MRIKTRSGSPHRLEVVFLHIVYDLLTENLCLHIGGAVVEASPNAGIDDLLEGLREPVAWQASGAVRYAPEQPAYVAELSRVREQLDANTFAGAWAEGNAMNADQSVDYTLELLAEPYAGRPADR